MHNMTYKLKTPFYFYNIGLLNETLENVCSNSVKYQYNIHYALKANANSKLLKAICTRNIGADCVSGNEILLAIKHGFKPEKIVFAGVGKTDEEIRIALENDIYCFNCESLEELQVINDIAEEYKKKTNVAIRVTPGVDGNTHEYITTGLNENKFGFKIWEIDLVIEQIEKLENLNFIGLHFHIGSQITDLSVFKDLCTKVNEIVTTLNKKCKSISYLNLGGGLGIDYENPEEYPIPDFESYFKIFNENLKVDKSIKIHFELGRSIVGQIGELITRVLYTKPGINKTFAIVDAGMTELMRPALYKAVHKIENLSSDNVSTKNYEVAGPICESSDSFAKKIELPETKRGDFLSIKSTGAYGEVMASTYNQRSKVKAYYSNNLNISSLIEALS